MYRAPFINNFNSKTQKQGHWDKDKYSISSLTQSWMIDRVMIATRLLERINYERFRGWINAKEEAKARESEDSREANEKGKGRKGRGTR